MGIFTTDDANDFVFTIPNSTQSITIPANYIESHLPESIIVLIRLFYWYFISRYIMQDIFKTINNLRRGDVFNVQSEDVKADIL